MAIVSGNYTLLVGCNESQPKAVRANTSDLGSAHDFYPETASGKPDEGVPTISNGRGGRAAIIAQRYTPLPAYTDEWRRLIGKIETMTADLSEHSAAPALPLTSAADDFAFGVRFKWIAPYTGDGISDTDSNLLFVYGRTTTSVPPFGLGFQAQDDTDETLGARLYLFTPGSGTPGYEVSDAGVAPFGVVTGSPASWYIQADQWYRVTVRCFYDGSTGMTFKIYVRDESAGTTYTFTYDGTIDTTDWNLGAGQDTAWQLGCAFDGSGGSAFTTAQAAVDEAWVYDAAMSDEDATRIVVDGIDIPWVMPSYETLAHKVRFAVTNEKNPFPPTRALATGTLAADSPAGMYGTRPRVRYEGYEPNRPWSLRFASMMWDSAGRRKGRTNNRFDWENFDAGLIRRPGHLPKGSCTDLRNVEFSGEGMRRRRGFGIVNDLDPTRDDPALGRFFSFRTTANELFRCAKIGTTLYSDDGSGNSTALDTGFDSSETPSFVHFRDRCAVLTGSNRVIWDGASITDFDGEAAPSTGTQAVSGGGTLDGDFYYAYTFYDPVTGDETAPYIFPSGPVSPSTQGVLLGSLDNAPTEARFTQQRIYRTVSGGAAPNFFLTAVQALATSYADAGDSNGVISLDNVGGTYTTLVPPENFSFGIVHAGRCFYAGGTNGDRVYRSEAGTLNRFQADAYTAHKGPVRALAARGNQLVVITDRTVELVDSDWVRDSNGATFENIAVVSTTVGGVGHAAIIDADDQIFWLDQRGIYTLQGDAVKKITKNIDNLFRFFNWGRGTTFTGGYNHLREQLWFTVASAELQSENALNQTQLVYQLGPGQWSIYDLDAVHCGPYDDDLQGTKFGILDSCGIWKEMEAGDSDGLGDGVTVAAKHAGTIDSVTSTTLTDAAQTWTVDEFRGFGIVIVEADGTLHYHTIRTNTATVLTLDRPLDAAVAADDVYYIGGIKAYCELAEAFMQTSNRKTSRQLHSQFDDLTRGENL